MLEKKPHLNRLVAASWKAVHGETALSRWVQHSLCGSESRPVKTHAAWNPSITISSVIPKLKPACKIRQMLPHISDATIFPRKHNAHPRVNRVVKGLTKSVFAPFFSHFIWALHSFTEAFGRYGGFVWFIKFSWLFPLKAVTLNHTFVWTDVFSNCSGPTNCAALLLLAWVLIDLVFGCAQIYRTSLNSTPKLSFKESLTFGPKNIKFL